MYRTRIKRDKSGFEPPAKAKQFLAIPTRPLGQSYPQRCPHSEEAEPLGIPLSIHEAALLIGCSTWTVRQKFLPAGLPYFRLGPTGKLTFYRNQVIRWLLARQQKGGML